MRQTLLLGSETRVPVGVLEGRAPNITMEVMNASRRLFIPATHSKPLLMVLPLYKNSHVFELLRVSGDGFLFLFCFNFSF